MAQKIRVGGLIQNDHLASLSVLAVGDQPGIAATVLDALGKHNINVQFVVMVIDHENQDHCVLCVDRDDLNAGLAALTEVRDQLGAAAIKCNAHIASLAIFGPDFRERPGIAGQMFSALAARGVNILSISTSISTVNCIIESDKLRDAALAVAEQFELP